MESKEIVHKGKVYITPPSFALWSYNTPVEKYIYIRNKEVITYEPLLEQAIIATLDENIDFMTILKEAKETEKGSFISVVGDIEFHITSDEKGVPRDISYIDKLQNVITIEFLDPKVNLPIDGSTYEPNLPEDTDILMEN